MIANKFKLLVDNPFSKLSALQLRLVTGMAILPIGDFLLYQGRYLGITLALFLFTLASASFCVQSRSCQTINWKLSFPLLILGLLPIVETLNVLTAVIGIAATTASILLFDGQRKMENISTLLSNVGLVLITMPVRSFKDMHKLNKMRSSLNAKAQSYKILRNWLFPVILACGFLWLFSLANPIIFGWLASIDLFYLLSLFSFERILFWAVLAIICWPLIRVKLKKLKKHSLSQEKKRTASQSHSDLDSMLNEPQVLRALLLFNLLFAVQTFLDVFYLWNGGQLPEGVTYSQYVHRGTYILLTTTLLAAAFILFVTSKKRAMESSFHIRLLLLVWAAQNIFLVISTMMRMELYIEAYALTYLRVAALVWMFLVMIGLGLIAVRLLRGYTNDWLVNANLVSLILTAYIISFANMPYLIGSYNVSIAINNPGKRLDIQYFNSLGENTVPVIDGILNYPDWQNNKTFYLRSHHTSPYKFESRRNRLFHEISYRQKDWRQWSFRRWRLVNYLEKTN